MKRLGIFILTLIIILGSLLTVSAQQYYFRVDKEYVDVYINKDASIFIAYEITFSPVSGYHDIDIVDIGFPSEFYDISSVTAEIDGDQLPSSYIMKSGYIDIGVEVHLGSRTIKAGDSGTLKVRGTNRNMVFQDDERSDYASMEFVPTWFGSQYVTGTTDLKVRVHFPKGVGPEETIYHYYEYTRWYRDEHKRIVFEFHWPDANMSKQYRVGVSFPKKYVDRIYKVSAWEHFANFFAGLFAFLCNPCMWWFYFIVIIIVISVLSSRARMRKYLPPSLKVEGVGIKRGLTAVEAAVLEEMPLNKVVSMIIFGLVKKKGLKVLDFKPLRVQKMDIDYPWYDYEEAFFKAIKKDGSMDKTLLEDLLVDLIKKVAKKLKGFNLKLTRKYYRSIVVNAWQLVRKANIPDLQAATMNKNLEWLLLDEHFSDKATHLPQNDIYLPMFWRHYIPYSHGGGSGAGNLIKLPSTQFANDFVKGFEVMSNNLVKNVNGLLNNVTKVTNPPPKSSGSSGSWSGGSGCACACACAGCACACAGGGR